ncbi:sensor domain-containing diguanylate cyclase [Vibrio sinaloensis]|uniref:sensor domain-containing diguanylate cyclase n=1 Tax=Photobacterium sp. (strain ATCC 43367) TaxID=379097 RepID=UPI00206968D9|nr:sensor domain-containing diguanylate cyclase [Vibrio sinaloensis]UPQ87393.1 sensor domain-containing diguanylate cyclase [Vibrio sinaloensis]
MSYLKLLTAHREVNKLLAKLALGMGKEELNHRVVDLSESWFGERRASILRLDNQDKRLYLEYAPNLPEFYNQAIEGVSIGPNVGSCGAAAYRKSTVVVDNINQHINWAPFTSLTQQANLHACWSVPILSSKKSAMGTFAIYSHEPSTPEAHELEVLEMLASLYAVAWEKYELEHQLHYHARYDSLTRCLNRRALLQRARDCLNTDLDYVACFFADIDQFKQINDHYGHEVGDKVLAQVGECFNQIFTACSLNGRYGGDEFVTFAFANDLQAFEEVEQKFNQQIEQLAVVDGLTVRVSLGKAVAKVFEVASLQQLIKQADQAMYQIKHANRCDQDHGNSAAMR